MNSIGRYIHSSVCTAPGALGPGGRPPRSIISSAGSGLGDATPPDSGLEPSTIRCSPSCRRSPAYRGYPYVWLAILRRPFAGRNRNTPHGRRLAVGSKKSYYSLCRGGRPRRVSYARPRTRRAAVATASSSVIKPDHGAARKHFIFTDEH